MSSARTVCIIMAGVVLAACGPMGGASKTGSTPADSTAAAPAGESPAAADAGTKPEETAAAPTETAAKPGAPSEAPAGAAPNKPT